MKRLAEYLKMDRLTAYALQREWVVVVRKIERGGDFCAEFGKWVEEVWFALSGNDRDKSAGSSMMHDNGSSSLCMCKNH